MKWRSLGPVSGVPTSRMTSGGAGRFWTADAGQTSEKPSRGERRRLGRRRRRSAGAALQSTSLPFGQATPDAEPLVMPEGVLQALRPYVATAADPLGLPG